jgi:hypothetical protein
MGTAGNEDFATVKYAATNGAKLWAVRYNNGDTKDYDGAVGVAVFNTIVYVAGESMGKTTDLDLAVIRDPALPRGSF